MKTIVFDFGNVIGFFDHRLVTNRLVPYAGISADAIHALLWDSQLEDDYEAGRISTNEFLRRVKEACRLQRSEDEIIAAYEDIFWPNPEVIALLPLFKPCYRLLLASNTNELHARKFLAQFAEPLRIFDHLILSHEAGARKPKPAFFEHCQCLTNCAAHECLFIDDLAANVAGAQASGWHGLLYRPTDEVHQQLIELAHRPAAAS
jgi:putative hydrolase of the HAD superfamily